MVQKSFTRLTLALDIIKKLNSGPYAGYHELSIIKHQINLFDIISLESASSISITCDNHLVPCDNRNICWKAVELIKNEFGINKSVKIHINKNIPVMGGLAGGSANAATVLLLLNEYWNLCLPIGSLMELGRKLGMDVPYYFIGGTAFDSEATGCLKKISTDLNFVFLLAIPSFGVATKEAYQGLNYSNIDKNRGKTSLMAESLQNNDIKSVIENMHNDFEGSVFIKYPALAKIKQDLLDAGCDQAIMSGSGSTIIGIASCMAQAEKVQKKVNFKTIIASSL